MNGYGAARLSASPRRRGIALRPHRGTLDGDNLKEAPLKG